MACKKIIFEIEQDLAKKKESRMKWVIVPDEPVSMDIGDKEGNSVWRIFVYKPQNEDVMKALRRKGYTPRLFSYNKQVWQAENEQRKQLEIEVKNCTTELRKQAVDAYGQLFHALMHLKVMRAYIDGVLRFGIPPKFFIAIVMPKKGCERSILNDMNKVLADESLKDMYGEKQDAGDAEDYWPFVSVPLTSPNFMHATKD